MSRSKHATSYPVRIRVGLVVSKKVANKAVVRNRIRRRLREALWRLMNDEKLADAWRFDVANQRVDMVVVAKPAATEANFQGLYEALLTALQKSHLLMKVRPQQAPSHTLHPHKAPR